MAGEVRDLAAGSTAGRRALRGGVPLPSTSQRAATRAELLDMIEYRKSRVERELDHRVPVGL